MVSRLNSQLTDGIGVVDSVCQTTKNGRTRVTKTVGRPVGGVAGRTRDSNQLALGVVGVL